MDTSTQLASYIGPIYLVLGLSVLLYAKEWKKLVGEYQKNHFALLTMMILYLIVGLLIIRMHNVWEWSLWVVITLTGWIVFLKGVFYFLFPGEWIRGMMQLGKNMTFLYIAGLVMTFFGAWMSYVVYLV